ncbi:Class A beta-lactamase-related serine hydrolase [Tenacibaculum sp. 190130A14a]|uniref:Class A beta-lactamase-related serine hydrolase n=1 Tax=Tenacibaculum polynesiense TaxID=3137857 RepID=A0ABP1EY68_9FLAO
MKRTYKTLPLVITFIGLICFQLSCTKNTLATPENKQRFNIEKTKNLASKRLVDYMINELMKLPSTPPGMSLAISKNDTTIYKNGYGYKSLKTKEKVTSSTQFRMGSLSRVITITALLKLIEKDQLSFDDSLEKVLPTYPKKKYPISIKQIASGLSGMPNYTKEDKFEQTSYSNLDQAINVFSHIPLTNQPGEKYQYSTHSFTLLSKIMEQASNQSYSKILEESIFNPLNLNSTGIENLNDKSPKMTGLFKPNNEGVHKGYLTEIISPKDYSYSWAGAGMISTPSDLVKLGNSYINGFIKKETLDTIFEIQTLNSKDTIRQSIGWDKNWDMDDRKVFEQDGSAEGTRNIISVFPKENLSISLMTNAFRLWAIEETAHTLAIPFLTEPSPVKQPIGNFKLDIKEDVRGNWVKRNGMLVLNGENDRLIIRHEDQDDEVFKIIYLNRGNKYAVIHPDGILYLEIDLTDKNVSGKVMYYRGPNLHKPSTEPPYLKFVSLT